MPEIVMMIIKAKLFHIESIISQSVKTLLAVMMQFAHLLPLDSNNGNRREKIRNEVTREELGQKETVVDKIRKRRLTWFGHVTRMDDKRLPAAALYGHVEGT